MTRRDLGVIFVLALTWVSCKQPEIPSVPDLPDTAKLTPTPTPTTQAPVIQSVSPNLSTLDVTTVEDPSMGFSVVVENAENQVLNYRWNVQIGSTNYTFDRGTSAAAYPLTQVLLPLVNTRSTNAKLSVEVRDSTGAVAMQEWSITYDTTQTIYVSKNGSDGLTGASPWMPMASLRAGIQRAKSAGKNKIVMTEGTFNERASSVELPSGYSLRGGFDMGNWLPPADLSKKTLVQLDSGGLLLKNINASTQVQDLQIQSADATTSGSSSYGIRVIQANARVLIERNSIYAGAGVAGTAGTNGSAGANGSNGVAGSAAIASNEVTSGGNGAGSSCGAWGGRGGNGGYASASGASGSVGGAILGWMIAQGGRGGSSAGGVTGAAGMNGVLGAAGTDGNVSGVWGLYNSVTGEWTPDTGVWGQSGISGSGGGGGGGGAGYDSFFGTDQRGASGGGGGSGGCGGAGGSGGQGGGSSIGILIAESDGSKISITNNVIQTSSAGDGALGGWGGLGGAGGMGALGGGSSDLSAGAGGKGGNGALGGRGGHGGNGSGGHSVGVFEINRMGGLVDATQNQFTIGAAGRGAAVPGVSSGYTGFSTSTLSHDYRW